MDPRGPKHATPHASGTNEPVPEKAVVPISAATTMDVGCPVGLQADEPNEGLLVEFATTPTISNLPPLWTRQLEDLAENINRAETEAGGLPHAGLDRARLAYANSIITYAGGLADLASREPSHEAMKNAVVSMRDFLRLARAKTEP